MSFSKATSPTHGGYPASGTSVPGQPSYTLGQVSYGSLHPHNITIELLDENGKVAMTWFLSNAWAVKMTKSEAKASDREISIDYIEFAHEGMTIKQ